MASFPSCYPVIINFQKQESQFCKGWSIHGAASMSEEATFKEYYFKRILKKTLLHHKIFKYSILTVHCKEKYLWDGFLACRVGITVSKFASVQHTSLPRIHQLVFAPTCQKQLLQRFLIWNNGGMEERTASDLLGLDGSEWSLTSQPYILRFHLLGRKIVLH